MREGILTENIIPPKRTKDPIIFVAEKSPIDSKIVYAAVWADSM